MSADEWALPRGVGVLWCADARAPFLVQEAGNAMLMVPPRQDDPDQRRIVLRVQECAGVLLGPPSRQARSSHRLWDRGLRECGWVAEVTNSRWLAAVAQMRASRPARRVATDAVLRHWVLLFEDVTVECLGHSLTARRLEEGVQVVRFE